MSQLNFPGRATTSVPAARSISRPCPSASVWIKLVRNVFRSLKYLSSGVEILSAGTATAGAAVAPAAAGAPNAGTVSPTKATPNISAPRRKPHGLNKISLSRVSIRSILQRRRHEHLARAVRLQLADDPGLLHSFQQPRGAVVTDLQTPLHVRDRRLPLGRDDLHRLIVQLVLLDAVGPATELALAVLVLEARNRCLRPGQHLFDVIRRR